jgi:hypothetical protein
MYVENIQGIFFSGDGQGESCLACELPCGTVENERRLATEPRCVVELTDAVPPARVLTPGPPTRTHRSVPSWRPTSLQMEECKPMSQRAPRHRPDHLEFDRSVSFSVEACNKKLAKMTWRS